MRAQTEVPAIAALTAKPCRVSAAVSVPQQRRLAAEQMGAAGDVEEETMRRIERHQRREAVAPVGDVFERLAVSGLVGVVHRKFRTHRARIGERQADGETGTHGGLVEGIEQNRVVVFRDDDVAGSLPSPLPLAGEAVSHRQMRYGWGLYPHGQSDSRRHPHPNPPPQAGEGAQPPPAYQLAGGVLRALPLDAVDGQVRQPQAEDTTTVR